MTLRWSKSMTMGMEEFYLAVIQSKNNEIERLKQMKQVPKYWWDFLWYRDNKGNEQYLVVVESDRSDRAEYILCNNITHALDIISELNAGRMTWPTR